MIDFFQHLYSLFNDIAPFLILGFLVSGILSVTLTVDFISKYLGNKSYSSVVLASILGVPLPLCSCGVIPVTAFLRKHGASKGSSTSFLISTPQTGVDSIMVTYSLLGPILAIYRPIVAFISGIVGGSIVHAIDKKEDGSLNNTSCDDECCDEYSSNSKFIKILHYGFIRLPLDIVSPLVFGLIISALISILIPQNYFGEYGTGIIGMLIMLLLSLPTYICATASVPIAFALFTKGFSLGAVLVFLMAGPATNITTISVMFKVLGRRSLIVYLLTIVSCSLMGGIILDAFSPNLNIFASEYHVHMHGNSIINILCSVFLLFIILNSFRMKFLSNNKTSTNILDSDYIINVDGMTCSHCEESVQKSLLKINGINSVTADHKQGIVTILGKNYNIKEIKKLIVDLGYEIK